MEHWGGFLQLTRHFFLYFPDPQMSERPISPLLYRLVKEGKVKNFVELDVGS